LVLASGSPRRRELLAQLGLSFEVMVRPVDETAYRHPEPGERVRLLAGAKARAVAGELEAGVVLGADTLVAVDGRVLGKPAGAGEARRMLEELQNRWHRVYTGVAVADAATGRMETVAVQTAVLMRPMTAAEIDRYVATGEPLDKAGAYGIQGLGAVFVSSIEGSYSNVVGLPLDVTAEMLERFGITVL